MGSVSSWSISFISPVRLDLSSDTIFESSSTWQRISKMVLSWSPQRSTNSVTACRSSSHRHVTVFVPPCDEDIFSVVSCTLVSDFSVRWMVPFTFAQLGKFWSIPLTCRNSLATSRAYTDGILIPRRCFNFRLHV